MPNLFLPVSGFLEDNFPPLGVVGWGGVGGEGMVQAVMRAERK